jgi:hypothetical protein
MSPWTHRSVPGVIGHLRKTVEQFGGRYGQVIAQGFVHGACVSALTSVVMSSWIGNGLGSQRHWRPQCNCSSPATTFIVTAEGDNEVAMIESGGEWESSGYNARNGKDLLLILLIVLEPNMWLTMLIII